MTRIVGTVSDATGLPAAPGDIVRFTLTNILSSGSGLITDTPIDAVIDVDGFIDVDLYPNTDSLENSMYRVTHENWLTGSKLLGFVTIPDTDIPETLSNVFLETSKVAVRIGPFVSRVEMSTSSIPKRITVATVVEDGLIRYMIPLASDDDISLAIVETLDGRKWKSIVESGAGFDAQQILDQAAAARDQVVLQANVITAIVSQIPDANGGIFLLEETDIYAAFVIPDNLIVEDNDDGPYPSITISFN